MKNKLYYVLFLIYAAMVGFILYINGVFTAAPINMTNLLINGGFLAVIGVLFLVSTISFNRLNRCTDELTHVAGEMYHEYKENGKNLWTVYQDKKDLFHEDALKTAFMKYKARMRSYRVRRGYSNTCDMEEFINEDLLDRVGMSYFNSGISGTLTGLGILGTFLGLSLGLGSFTGDDIYTISDNVGPLLSGMKVAFHTSVYGIFFSLVFNFVYRSIMADAYEKLETFLVTFRQCAMPQVASEDENTAAMLVYQANTSNSMKQMLELLKGNAMEQTVGVERIVNQFQTQLAQTMGTDFQKLGSALKNAGEVQQVNADNCRSLIEAATALVETNSNMQTAMTQMLQRQEALAKELADQGTKLSTTCDNITDEVSNQLYTFDQMRSVYEEK